MSNPPFRVPVAQYLKGSEKANREYITNSLPYNQHVSHTPKTFQAQNTADEVDVRNHGKRRYNHLKQIRLCL